MGRTNIATADFQISQMTNYTSDGTADGMSATLITAPSLHNNPMCQWQQTDSTQPTNNDPFSSAKFVGYANWYGQDAEEWLFMKDDTTTTVYVNEEHEPIGVSTTNSTSGDIVSVMSLMFFSDTLPTNTFEVPPMCPPKDSALAADASARVSAVRRAANTLHSVMAFLA